jgi:peptide/nickel transport system permease protein
MTVYIARRLLWLPLILIAVTLVTYALGVYGPGDPVLVLLGKYATPEAAERLRHQLGLDRPFIVQYVDYLWRTLQGNFGESLKYRGQPVGRLMGERLLITVQLNAVSLALGTLLGLPLGIIAALKRNTWLDRLVVALSVAGISLPTFVVIPVLVWFFARELPFWTAGTFGIRIGLPPGGWEGLFSPNIIMPVLVLALGPMAVFTRQMRASFLDVIDQDYIRTARAKGLREWAVVVGHALKNALIPIMTLLGLMLGSLVEGTFITETLFGIPGLGRLGVEALFARDYPVIMAETLLIAVAYILANLAVDLSYAFLDPRVRYA